MNPKKYTVKIKGNSPLCWNIMSRELYEDYKKLKGNEIDEFEHKKTTWLRKAEYDKSGNNTIAPARWIKSALIEACKKTRIVPHFATRKSETYTFYVQSFMIFEKGIVCPKSNLKPFQQFLSAQGTKGSSKVWRTKPFVESWSAEYKIVDPAGRMKVSELRSLLDFAGMFLGLGDNRVHNFGRFNVQSITEV